MCIQPTLVVDRDAIRHHVHFVVAFKLPYQHLINMLQNVEHIANNTFNLSFINI